MKNRWRLLAAAGKHCWTLSSYSSDRVARPGKTVPSARYVDASNCIISSKTKIPAVYQTAGTKTLFVVPPGFALQASQRLLYPFTPGFAAEANITFVTLTHAAPRRVRKYLSPLHTLQRLSRDQGPFLLLLFYAFTCCSKNNDLNFYTTYMRSIFT